MEEVACKNKGFAVTCWVTIVILVIFGLLLGGLVLFVGIMGPEESMPVWTYVFCGVPVAACFGIAVYYIVLLVGYYRLPGTLITYGDEELKLFADGKWTSLDPKTIKEVRVKGNLAKSSLIQFMRGKDTGDLVLVADAEYRVRNIAGPDETKRRILGIIEDAKIKASLRMKQ